MEYVCPLCNGLKDIEILCELCGKPMKDKGPIVNFLDEYSPYLSNDITQVVDGAKHNNCTHVFKCSACGYFKNVEIARIKI